jgi:hypothetical protein
VQRQVVEQLTNRLTLKALANSSPGFALKPWVQKSFQKTLRNSKGVATALMGERRRNPDKSGLRLS